MSLRLLAGLGLGASIVPALALAQGAAGDPVGNWSAIVNCGAARSADERHACVDSVLRAAGVLSEERVAQEVREEFGREDRPEPRRAAAAAPPPRADAPAVAAAPPKARREEIDQLVTTIASVRTVGYKRLRVTTTDGSVWKQTRDETFNTLPKPGDGFAIERASMGSFQCRFGRSSNYRCERVD